MFALDKHENSNKENAKRQVYNLVFFAGVDTKRYGKLKLPKDGKDCHDNVVTLHERQGNSYDR
jgi:cephalosporin-C deacetylase-like acetyl esterase